MKKPFALVAALCAIAFATPGCASVTSIASKVTGGVPAVAAVCQNNVTIKRTWATTLDFYLRVTNVYTAAIDARLLDKPTVAVLEPLRQKGVAVRKLGTAAYDACNASKLGAQIASLSVIIDRMRPLIPGAPAQ